MPKIDEYIPAAGRSAIEELKIIAAKLKDKTILNVNSTAVGGGPFRMKFETTLRNIPR